MLGWRNDFFGGAFLNHVNRGLAGVRPVGFFLDDRAGSDCDAIRLLLVFMSKIKIQEVRMNKTKKVCDLCGLAVETPGFTLKTKEGEKVFCCEGCKGIYKMLHEDLVLPESEQA